VKEKMMSEMPLVYEHRVRELLARELLELLHQVHRMNEEENWSRRRQLFLDYKQHLESMVEKSGKMG